MKTPRGTTHQIYPISNNFLVTIKDGSLIKVSDNESLSFWGMTATKI